MRKPLLSALLLLLLLAAPAGAVLTDDEVNNNTIGPLAIQIVLGVMDLSELGTLALLPGDIDYLGIQGLLASDVIIISTTPREDIDMEDPDTIAALFDDMGVMECLSDDAFNNDLDTFPMGYGSLCRYLITASGDYFVGVTGYSATPFDGTHTETGDYSLTVTVLLPEPGLVLQLGSGLAGLALLARRRRRKVAA